MNKKFASVCLLLITGCAVGKDFCISSGHVEDTPQFDQCVVRYKAQSDLYNYCFRNKSIVGEGKAMQQCLADARGLKQQYNYESRVCNQEAETVFPLGSRSTIREYYVTHYNGVSQHVVDAASGQGDLYDVRRNMVTQCMSTKGWGNSWEQGKVSVNTSAVPAQMSKIKYNLVNSPVKEADYAALHYAAAHADLSALRKKTSSSNVNAVNSYGHAALHFAALNGHLDVVRFLIEEKGADKNLRSYKGESAYDMAVKKRQRHVMDYLAGQ